MTTTTTTQHTIDCMDASAKDNGLPTYTELVEALRYLRQQASLSDLPPDNRALQNAWDLVGRVSCAKDEA
jgi:hypothetical protein